MKKLTYRELAEKYLSEVEQEQYLANVKSYLIDNECNLHDERCFIESSFTWAGSAEGADYWREINKRISNNV